MLWLLLPSSLSVFTVYKTNQMNKESYQRSESIAVSVCYARIIRAGETGQAKAHDPITHLYSKSSIVANVAVTNREFLPSHTDTHTRHNRIPTPHKLTLVLNRNNVIQLTQTPPQ